MGKSPFKLIKIITPANSFKNIINLNIRNLLNYYNTIYKKYALILSSLNIIKNRKNDVL